MKLLLTSGGLTNPSIHAVLVQPLDKPIDECRALCVPTAQWGHPMCGPTSVRDFAGAEPKPDWQYITGLGWASLGVLELTALPTIGAERWVAWVRKADVSWSTEATPHICAAPDRGLLRRVAVRTRRPHPRCRRLFDLPAPEPFPDEHHG